jgi:hypothetical protein
LGILDYRGVREPSKDVEHLQADEQ